jgi:hypothetical protein
MAVALRGYTQGTTQASGAVAISWPAGTVAGDLAVVIAHDGGHHHSHRDGPTVRGWLCHGEGVWTKKLVAADLVSPLPVNGKVTFLQTFSGASRIGNVRWHYGLRLWSAGSGLLVHGFDSSWITTLVPGATDRLGNQIRSVTYNKPNAVWFRALASAGWADLSSHDDDHHYQALEILPSLVPSSPTIVTPRSSEQLDAANAVVFSWLHQSNSNSEQDGVQIRVRAVGSGTWSYVTSGGTITTTVTTLTQTAQSASINAGVLTSGTQYEFNIATREFGSLGAYSSTQQFLPVSKPTVTSITPASTVESLTPQVAWTATMGLGSQEAWQVRISKSTDPNSETPLWDSGIIQGTATQTVAPATVPWTNGQTLYAWVRVQQTGGLWSPWTQDNATFTVSWTPPVAPSSVIASNVANQPLQVTVAGIGDGLDLTIEMSVDGGENWTPVNTLTNPGTPTVAQIPLAGYGIITLFRARTSVTLSDVVVLYSAWVESSPLASTDPNYYLVSVDGNTFLQVRMVTDAPHVVNQGFSVTYGHGATRPRQDQTVAMGESGTTTLQVRTLDEEYEVTHWLTTQGTWWLRWGPERSPTLTDKPATLMSLSAPVQSGRRAQFNTALREVSFSWIEQ